MKLLYLNHNIAGAGTFIRAFHLAREMTLLGHDVTLVTTRRQGRVAGQERALDGVRVIEAPDLLTGSARTGWDVWNAGWRVQRLARERFDLIHAFDCRPAVIVPALAQRQRDGAPLFLDWADWWGRGGTIGERSGWAVRTFFGPVETWFEEHFRTGATANTTISESLRQRCIGLGVAPERVLALPNGCEAPVPDVYDRTRARRALGLGDEPIIAHLGVMQPADAAFLFDAFRVVHARMPAARLVLIGKLAGAVPADVRAAVMRTGFVDQDVLRAWLSAADFGVVPLRDNLASVGRWPGKISEYLTAGLPIVLPRVGEAAAYAERSGAAVTCGADARAFGDAMIEVAQDAGARARMADAARALAAGDLAWSRIAAQLSAFYAGSTDAATGSVT